MTKSSVDAVFWFSATSLFRSLSDFSFFFFWNFKLWINMYISGFFCMFVLLLGKDAYFPRWQGWKSSVGAQELRISKPLPVVLLPGLVLLNMILQKITHVLSTIKEKNCDCMDAQEKPWYFHNRSILWFLNWGPRMFKDLSGGMWEILYPRRSGHKHSLKAEKTILIQHKDSTWAAVLYQYYLVIMILWTLCPLYCLHYYFYPLPLCFNHGVPSALLMIAWL